jgi:hypothetical protein
MFLTCHAELFLPPWYGGSGFLWNVHRHTTTQCNIPGDRYLHSYQHGNVKSCIATFDGNTAWVTDSATTEIINKQLIKYRPGVASIKERVISDDTTVTLVQEPGFSITNIKSCKLTQY